MDKVIALDKKEIKRKLEQNFGGFHSYGWAYWLIVRPDGNHRVISVDGTRRWNAWRDNDFAFGLPAPYGDGSCELYDLARQLLDDPALIKKLRQDDVGLLDYVQDNLADDWQIWLDESNDWYAEEWLNALNGQSNDAGFEFDPHPFTFEWKEID